MRNLIFNRRYKVDYYYTFEEIVGKGLASGLSINDIFETYGLDYGKSGLFTLVEGNYVLKDHLETLWERLKIRFGEHFWIVSPKELDLYILPAEDKAIIRTYCVTLVGVMMNTYDRYSVLLNAYANAKERLMDKLRDESDAITRFNDTPQNEEADDEFEGDNHVTNLTRFKTENARETMTPIARLEELTRLYDNIIKDWSNEFQSIFIEEDNIYGI